MGSDIRNPSGSVSIQPKIFGVFPQYTTTLDDTFNRADTTIGGPNNTNVGNGWIDVHGTGSSAGYNITSGVLIGHLDGIDGNQWKRDFLLRPNISLYSCIEMTYPAGFNDIRAVVGRKQAGSSDCYMSALDTSGHFYAMTSISGSQNSYFNNETMESFSTSKDYIIRQTIYPTYGVSGSTTVQYEVREAATGIVVWARSTNDTSSSLQPAGQCGIVVWGNANGSTTVSIPKLSVLSIPTIRNVGFIGDSTDVVLPTGAFDVTAQMVCNTLTGMTGRRIICNNQAISGMSSTDFNSSGTILAPALAAMAGVDVINVRLGCNDAREGITKSTYKSNMINIVTAASAVAPVLVNDSWYFIPEAAGLWSGASAALQIQYSAANDEVCQMGIPNVYRGLRSPLSGKDFPDMTDNGFGGGHPEKRGGVFESGQIGVIIYNFLSFLGKL